MSGMRCAQPRPALACVDCVRCMLTACGDPQSCQVTLFFVDLRRSSGRKTREKKPGDALTQNQAQKPAQNDALVW